MRTATPLQRRETLGDMVLNLAKHLRDLERLEADVEADTCLGLPVVLDRDALDALVEAVGCVEEAIDDLRGNPPEARLP